MACKAWQRVRGGDSSPGQADWRWLASVEAWQDQPYPGDIFGKRNRLLRATLLPQQRGQLTWSFMLCLSVAGKLMLVQAVQRRH